MKGQLILLFMTLGIIANAQQKNETFYKDNILSKEVTEKKAKFKKVETTDPNGIVNVKIFDLKKDCLIKEKNFKDNKPFGIWTTFSEDCSILNKRDFSKLIYSDKQIDTLFNNVIEEGNPNNFKKAQYGNDENDIFKYLANNLKYPREAINEGLSGTVYLQLIITADGTVKMYSIIRGAHPFLDYESWELVSNMPKWNPAKKDGQPIDSFWNLPIRFSLK